MFKIGLLIVSITNIVLIINNWIALQTISTTNVFLLIGWALVILGLLFEGYPVVRRQFFDRPTPPAV